MASCVYDVVLSGHDVEVAILVLVAGIACVVVAGERGEIFLDVFVVVVEDCQHEGRGEGCFYVESAHCADWTFFASSCVVDFNVAAGERFAG